MKANQIVTIEKWLVGTKYVYWIIDESGYNLDGFTKKYQAIDAINRWAMVRKDKSVKIK